MHEEFVELAKELISENGRATVFKKSGNTSDEEKPWLGTNLPLVVIATQKSVYVPISDKQKLGLSFIPEELLIRASEVLLTGSFGIDLTEATVILDSVEFKIEWCYALKPGETAILYAFGIKR